MHLASKHKIIHNKKNKKCILIQKKSNINENN